jgi:hypothetical protein
MELKKRHATEEVPVGFCRQASETKKKLLVLFPTLECSWIDW